MCISYLPYVPSFELSGTPLQRRASLAPRSSRARLRRSSMSAQAAGLSRRTSGRVRTGAPRLLIHEAVALDRHAAVRAQGAILTEEEPTIVHVVHQVHPEPGGERE